jgi:hypothetical protein
MQSENLDPEDRECRVATTLATGTEEYGYAGAKAETENCRFSKKEPNQ